MKSINSTNREDAGKLTLRLTVSGMMLFHGIHKLIYGHDFIIYLLKRDGWPSYLVYGVPVGEVAAPLLLLLGAWTRFASGMIIFTMAVSIYLFLGADAFALDQYGALKSQLNLFFIGSCSALFCMGPGKYTISSLIDKSLFH